MESGDRTVKILSVFNYFVAGIFGVFACMFSGRIDSTSVRHLFLLTYIIVLLFLLLINVDTEHDTKVFVFVAVMSTTILSIFVSYVLDKPYIFVIFQFILILCNIPGLRKYVFMVLCIMNVSTILLLTFILKWFSIVECFSVVSAFLMACWISFVFANRTSNMIQMIKTQDQSRDDMITLIEARFTEEKGANSAKSAFLANMSHEIRTPINAILGLNTMTLRESKEENIIEYAKEIEQASETLLSLVNDILDISKVESGKMEIIPVEYDLSSLLNDVSNMISFKAKAKNLEVKLDVKDDIPNRLFGDDVRIRQVLINLLTNAVKYTEKGTVTLSVSGEKVDQKIKLLFSVKDTGIGIKPEDMEKLFGKFERLDTLRNRNVEGTGLGMAITQKLLKLMNSELEVDSIYGEGSNFSFCLEQGIVDNTVIGEIGKRFERSKKSEESGIRYIAPDARILIVDDNATNRLVFKKLVGRLKVQIQEAASGREALELCQEREYDIIFLDHMMPEMDGIETLKRMRENSICPNIDTTVIALTANAISGSKEFYLDAGFDDYLSKPIDVKKLEKMIYELLPEEKVEVFSAEVSE